MGRVQTNFIANLKRFRRREGLSQEKPAGTAAVPRSRGAPARASGSEPGMQAGGAGGRKALEPAAGERMCPLVLPGAAEARSKAEGPTPQGAGPKKKPPLEATFM
ncbi:MAG: hypothetical protein U5P10_13175 [Spirochaetia bacterium]|nr:hypothetical protein [Spirochaetia bacterium]